MVDDVRANADDDAQRGPQLKLNEKLLSIASCHGFDGIGALTRCLKDHGFFALASSLSLQHRARRYLAHPSDDLEAQLTCAMASINSFLGEKLQCGAHMGDTQHQRAEVSLVLEDSPFQPRDVSSGVT